MRRFLFPLAALLTLGSLSCGGSKDNATPTPTAPTPAPTPVLTTIRVTLVDTVSPQLVTINRQYGVRVRLDNAALLARRIYATGLAEFEASWERDGRNLRRTLDRIAVAAAAASGDPYSVVPGPVSR